MNSQQKGKFGED